MGALYRRMDEFWSFAGVIALWIGVSRGLWWLHRRSVYAKQRRQMRQAVRAAAYVADGQKVFDTIRRPPSAAGNATGAALTAETHALLKRIQDSSAFFDKVNALRVDMLAAFGIEDYPPLSEILHIRRDLWAASEIVLAEDLSSFGESFAEAGAYERFRAEAAALLFKAAGAGPGEEGCAAPSKPPGRPAGAGPGEEDLIDLRLSLARGEAERLVPELKDAIRLARERDRLPTFTEIVAYPVAAIRALPGKLRIARAFLSEFYSYAAEIAGAIRQSQAMERGVSELRRAREELPRRLVTGFERASGAARQSASGLRRHYDFLVAAHDFQAKYEQTLRRAPQITERGRQFIARLELAEHSERLRLTSANFLIWLTRQLATGLAYFIAGLRQLHAVLSETPPGVLAAALVAPTPMRGRHLPAFRSYRMALGMSGLMEARPPLLVAAERTITPMKRKKVAKASVAAAPSEEKGKRAKLPKAPKPDGAAAGAPPPAKAEKLDNASAAKPAPAPKQAAAKQRDKAGKPAAKPAISNPAELKPDAEPAEPRTAAFPPEKRRSFLDRLLGRRPAEPTIGDLLAAAWEREHAAGTGGKVAAATPPETAPTLLAKLSQLPAEELPEDIEDQDEPVEEADAEDESGDDPKSLTSSVMEVQAKLAPRIRGFPWLRG